MKKVREEKQEILKITKLEVPFGINFRMFSDHGSLNVFLIYKFSDAPVQHCYPNNHSEKYIFFHKTNMVAETRTVLPGKLS